MFATPEGRRAAIQEEVYNYLFAVAEYLDQDPNRVLRFREGPLPQEPPAYRELKRCQTWGFPRDGGWLNQPAGYMQDVWAAERAVNQFKATRATSQTAEVR